MKSYICILAVFLRAILCTAVNEENAWWKTAVFYQVYPRSFKDSDGDGVGDLKGITQSADYFKKIGVDAIWLSPIYPSPMADFGYDISDFTAIDPVFGSMADFEDLLVKMREIDVKLVLDFVPNHSSVEHVWFKKSLNQSDPHYNDYKDFYVWLKGNETSPDKKPLPPNNWISVFSGSAWEWRDERQMYYLHKFAKQQPDLNYTNPNVVGNMTVGEDNLRITSVPFKWTLPKDIIKFWLDKGVDGFRMDSVQQIFEDENFPDEPAVKGTAGDTYSTLQHIYEMNLPNTYKVLKYWAQVVYERGVADGRQRAIFLEVYDNITTTMKYYGTGNESLEFPFNFNLLVNADRSTRPSELKQLIDDWMNSMPSGCVANWVVGNHDNGRVADRYGFEFVDAINMLTMVLPGIKVTYNGAEIGMQNTFIRWDQTVDPQGLLLGEDHYLEGTRDPERTPMQWDSSPSAGFSSNYSTWLPVNPNYWWLNVAAQLSSETSHLKVYQAMAKARKDDVFMHGKVEVLVPNNDTLLVVRSYNSSFFVLIINMGSEILTYTSQSLFASYGLDWDMDVVVGSINSGYKSGVTQQRGNLNISLRQKSAILLRSSLVTTTPSSLISSTSSSQTSSSQPVQNSTVSSSSRLLSTTTYVFLFYILFVLSTNYCS